MTLLFVIFVIGVSVGAFTVNLLGDFHKSELYNYVNSVLQAKDLNISPGEIFKQIFINYSKLILTLWFLGVTVIGVPLIVSLVGFEGFKMGFSVGFIFEAFKDLKGLVVVLTSMVPQGFIELLCIIILGISGIKFSLFLLKGGDNDKLNVNQIKFRIISHTIVSVFVLVVTAGGALIESFLSQLVYNLVFKNL